MPDGEKIAVMRKLLNGEVVNDTIVLTPWPEKEGGPYFRAWSVT